MSRALVLMSGGIDSAVALCWAAEKYDSLIAASFLYYLRPFRERLAVQRLLQTYPARLVEVPLPFLREAVDLPQPIKGVPEGYVSNRNLIFYSISAYLAETLACDAIVGGHNHDDQTDFPDASHLFFRRLEQLTNDALLSRKIQIQLPLSGWSKQEVLERALQWKVPLQNTWSCYWDFDAPCGKCASCAERAEAFEGLHQRDPLLS